MLLSGSTPTFGDKFFPTMSPAAPLLSQDQGRDYRAVNRQAWTRLASQGSAEPHFSEAKEWLDPEGWIHWPEVRNVLCLAAGGGQQAPLFASLNCNVVSADICPEQLEHDRQAARQHGFEIECVEADMLDLSALHGRDFDLVYQAISACYVPDVRRLYAEVSHVLRPGGFYRVQHWNPVHIQLADNVTWTGRGYELVRPCVSGVPHVWRRAGENGGGDTECWHYIHSMTDLVGGLCDAGFQILRFTQFEHYDEQAEPGSDAHVCSYVRPLFSMYALRV
jgi:SAM-dependent methyltransferase